MLLLKVHINTAMCMQAAPKPLLEAEGLLGVTYAAPCTSSAMLGRDVQGTRCIPKEVEPERKQQQQFLTSSASASQQARNKHPRRGGSCKLLPASLLPWPNLDCLTWCCCCWILSHLPGRKPTGGSGADRQEG